MLRVAGRLLLALALVAAGYVGYVWWRHDRPVTLPTPSGPHPVGRRTFDWTDQGRTDALAPDPRPRRVSVWLWYPAARGSRTTGPPARYTPGAWRQLHLPARVGVGETSFAEVRTHARSDVPVAAGRFPVVVLEPGLGFAAPHYQTLAEDLASHGTSRRLLAVWVADARFAAREADRLGRSGSFARHVATSTRSTSGTRSAAPLRSRRAWRTGAATGPLTSTAGSTAPSPAPACGRR